MAVSIGEFRRITGYESGAGLCVSAERENTPLGSHDGEFCSADRLFS